MNPFSIAFKKEKGKETPTIKVPGTALTFDKIYVDFEYNRRCCAKSLEVATHHFSSMDMWNKEEEFGSNVSPINLFINKKDDGIIISGNSLKEVIVLPNTPFSTSDADIQKIVMEVYRLIGYEVTEPEK